MGESFGTNPVTGSAAFTIPITASPGRSDFGPKLSLSYDSGVGNGPFGFGWNLSLPAITRKTDKGLPRYLDALESDVFLLTEAEDLVPVTGPNGVRHVDEASAPGWRIDRYRPRIEGLFVRIERWTNQDDGLAHWRSISRDNVLTIYGAEPASRLADPLDPGRIFSWLICETRDTKGNAIRYDYKAEDGTGVDLSQAHERNRGDHDDARRTANRYLKRIRYGNRLPLLDSSGHRPRFVSSEQIDDAGWMFELVFDYGEHDAESPAPGDAGSWHFRDDPFSSYRAGFEVRTCRLCQRVLIFHHFPDEPEIGLNCLVRSDDFTFTNEEDPTDARNPIYTFMRAFSQSGYRRQGGGYLRRSLPPVEFAYTRPIVQNQVWQVDDGSLENLPQGVDGSDFRWTDLHGEGIPGILVEQAGALFYKRNLSPISENGVELAPTERVASMPNLSLAGGKVRFMDLAGDGLPDLVTLDGPLAGYFEHDGNEGWQSFRPFQANLNRDLGDPNLQFVDLDGDGRTDVLVSEDDAFVWHPSLGEAGFGPAQRAPIVWDEEAGPRLVFSGSGRSVFLADLSGDGLADLVRIGNGEVCYWSNLGYGRFGAKITMDDAPRFDHPDLFDQRRLRLADIDGTGTTDLIYLHRDGVRLYFNQSGNRWSAPQILPAFPPVADPASIAPADLLGNGTTCLVWSSPLPGDSGRQLRYLDLVGGQKPHLLIRTSNNLGAETQFTYAPSTKFYLQDKRDGRPWITRLPFPVHVVERVERRDQISGNRFVTRYAYHHGYFDGEEREFRGFGMVEQWDTEEFTVLADAEAPSPTTNLDPASHVPPVLTKTWFHTGIYIDRDHVSDYFAGQLDPRHQGEYYREPAWIEADVARSHQLDDTILPPNLTVAEEREACRALKGAMLRQEVYALDGTGTAAHPHGRPFAVTEQNLSISLLQPRGQNRHAVFFTHPRESIEHHYERNPDDPRIKQKLTIEVDRFGNVLQEITAAYGRRTASADTRLTAADREKQSQTLVTYLQSRFTRAIDDPRLPDNYRTPLPAETRTYELSGFQPEAGAERLRFDAWAGDNFGLLDQAIEIPYEARADGVSPQRRLIEQVRTVYRSDDLSGVLAVGEVEAMALPGESYKLALTPSLTAHIFRLLAEGQPEEALIPDPAPLLEGTGEDQGGYVNLDGNWWIPSGRAFFDPGANPANPALTAAQELVTARQHFYQTRLVVDPFGQATTVAYDGPADPSLPRYDLLATRTTDALGNTVTAAHDYRVLQPRLVIDANDNHSVAAYDALGMVVATAVMGKASEQLGDHLTGFDPDPSLASLQAFVANPGAAAGSLLGEATTRIVYDVGRYHRAGQPVVSATLARATHVQDPGGAQSRIHLSFSYSDGFGREIQQKVQAEPGEAPQRLPPVLLASGDTAPGELTRDAAGGSVLAPAPRRWVGAGRTVFNNKGKPVRQYEPYFSPSHLFETEPEMTDSGVSKVMFYDPLARVVATLFPNHTYEKLIFGPWGQTNYDVNDTVAASGAETGDPRTDPDIGGYVGAYFAGQPATWQSWHTQRIGGQLGAAEQDAAQKAAVHANTPTAAHFDPLGRPFVTIAHNRYERNGAVHEEYHVTRVELDLEGNQRQVVDAKDRVVIRYEYDLLGNRLRQSSMESGERWLLNDVASNPIRGWDSRRCRRRLTYDELRRPTGLFVSEGGNERLAGRKTYGESQGAARNHRTREHQIFDAGGVITNLGYDFKGNLVDGRRDLLPASTLEVDWRLNPVASDGSYTSRSTYDALNRPISQTSPDGSVAHSTFNDANLLEGVAVRLRGAATATPFVVNIDYDAKAQRRRIEYGNGTATAYEYDPLTFRLVGLRTIRPAGAAGTVTSLFHEGTTVQDLRYIYDPFGNITRIEDTALKPVFHDGQQVLPVSRYTYDAVYRLIEAQGREQIGQTGFDSSPPGGNDRDYPFTGYHHPNDLQALRTYTEQYTYDAAGNIETLRHLAPGGGWQRRYDYAASSLLEPDRLSNRLTSTTLGNGLNQVEPYAHDPHGNMTAMPHLAALSWTFEDQLRHVDRGGGGTVHYTYDAQGHRLRKVMLSQTGTRRAERIYLGNVEIYREYTGNGAIVQLERESMHVTDDQRRIALVETQTIVNRARATLPVSLQRYQVGNHLGSACVELDGAGALISYEEYHPYGTSAFQAGRAAEVQLKRYRHSSKERDEETGFSYHGARYLMPWLGRWTAADPAAIGDGLNLYTYARNRPTTLIDPTGAEAQPDPMNYANFEEYDEAMASSGVPWRPDYAEEQWGKAVDKFDAAAPKSVTTDVDPAAVLREDVRRLQNVKTPTLMFIMPSHVRPYLRDQSAGIQHPYLRFMAQLNQRGGEGIAQFTNRLGMATVIAWGAGMAIGAGAAVGVQIAGPALLAGGTRLAASYTAAGQFIGATYPRLTAAAIAIGAGVSGTTLPSGGPTSAPAAQQAARNVWTLNPFVRGRILERILGDRIAGIFMRASNFPTIDKVVAGPGNVAQQIISIKSIDLGAASYQGGNAVFNMLSKYIDSLARFTSATRLNQTVLTGPNTQRVLEVAIPPNVGTLQQLQQLTLAAQEAARRGITLNVRVVQ